ncbi:MAG: LacI family DNA-binding transcriptional regulator [Candidatus Pseudobacter hemicellulosilyticus]|uniref:LacI family DNA-binding transcriptional regulator n=1 Tax=Candidatus Pseudobacter hemicellulosilyticus TaxID=3121375 RepID=A0AAJ6BFW2_9BACT|nr:MAG: LacI family DNA-binding transcriptional regulator [Pseudobacter sp.]
MKKVSLKDIASITGASTSTVSFILNGKASQMRISEALKKKVLATAKKLGYQPNQVAVSLRTGQTKIIGLLVEDISNNFFSLLAKTIEDEAEIFGYRVVYCSTENNNTKGQELLRMLAQRQVDGFLITPTQGMQKDIELLADQQKPMVLMDRFFPNLDIAHVLVDNYDGVMKGMKHLLSKGFQRIGFITVNLPLHHMEQREAAYVDAIAGAGTGKQKRKKFILQLDYNLPKEKMIQQILTYMLEQELDAVFFATNYLGILGLECIRDAGLRIPDDLAMVCFDDHDIFRLYLPGITVIQQPVEEIGKKAVHLLMDQLGKSKTSSTKKQVQLAAKFVLRGSTVK